jgi:hypothetical protein
MKKLYINDEAYKMPAQQTLDEETRYNYIGKMLKENPPKDDKRIRIKKDKEIRTKTRQRQKTG